MTRVKNGVTTKARHKKVLKEARGYFGSKHRLYKTAKEQLMHSGQYAYRDRRQKKREFRSLWITRINAAVRAEGMSYSRFIEGLTKAGVEVNRKMLSEVAINDEAMFANFIKLAKTGLEGKVSKEPVVASEKKETKKVAEAKTEEVVKEEKKAPVKKETTKKVIAKKETVKEEKTVAKKAPAKKATAKKTEK